MYYNSQPCVSDDSDFGQIFFNFLLRLKTNHSEPLIALQMHHINGMMFELSRYFYEMRQNSNTNELFSIVLLLWKTLKEKDNTTEYVRKVQQKLVEDYYLDEKNDSTWRKYVSSYSSWQGAVINLYEEMIEKATTSTAKIAPIILKRHKDFNKVVEYFWNTNLNSLEIVIGDDERISHCEMQALEGISTQSMQRAYIGVSKLPCFLCFYIQYNYNRINGTQIQSRGTHGKIYLGWIFPNNMLNCDIIKSKINELCKLILDNIDIYADSEFISDDPDNSISQHEISFDQVIIEELLKD